MEKIIYFDQVSIKDTLKLLTENHKVISGSELAKKINIPVATMNRLLSGSVTDPRASTLLPIADYFGISVDQLLGKTPLPLSVYKEEELKPSIKIPIFDLSDIAIHRQNDFKVTSFFTYLIDNNKIYKNRNRNIFAVEIKNSDFNPTFIKDTILIIDPHLLPPVHGDYVLVTFKKSQQNTIKKIHIDPPNSYLMPVITILETIKYDKSEHSILGVINESHTKLR